MRLNAPMRQQIIRKAIAAKFDPIVAKLKAENLAIGHAFYQHLFGKQKAAIAAVPKAFLHQPSEEEIKHGVDCKFQLSNGYTVRVDVPFTDPVPSANSFRNPPLGVIKDEALCNRYLAWQHAVEDRDKDKKEAYETLSALLKSLTTYNTLEKEWPEGKPFYGSLPGDFPGETGLPMVQIKHLNQILGIA
jgi:hypothetical protein